MYDYCSVVQAKDFTVNSLTFSLTLTHHSYAFASMEWDRFIASNTFFFLIQYLLLHVLFYIIVSFYLEIICWLVLNHCKHKHIMYTTTGLLIPHHFKHIHTCTVYSYIIVNYILSHCFMKNRLNFKASWRHIL